MTRFWLRYLHPLLQAIGPRHVLEVGADRGWNTSNLLAYCAAHDCRLDIVDPAPAPELKHALEGHAERFSYHPVRSTEAIPVLDAPDVALMDGDHNWATVYAELVLLFSRADEIGVPAPIVLSHDVAWPYARRDMYYSPDDLAATQRHPYAYRGMLPGRAELAEEGMNAMYANALHEGGPRNGVLTAIEDFIAQATCKLTFRTLPFFNGLGILVPDVRMTPEISACIASFFTKDALLQACMDIERDSMQVRAMLQTVEARLARRSEALGRARALLSEQAETIRTLRDSGS